MHAMLMESAVGEAGEGTPVKLIVNHKVSSSPNLQFHKEGYSKDA